MTGNTNPTFLIEYLHEFMWRRWYGDTHPNGCFQRLLQDIAEQKIYQEDILYKMYKIYQEAQKIKCLEI